MKFVPKPLEKTADISRGKQKWKEWIKGLTGLLFFGGIGWIALGLISDYVAESISETTEVKLFSWIEPGLEELSNTTKDAEYEKKIHLRIQPIIRKLLKNGNLRPLPYELTVNTEDEPNAFAIPGGRISVTTGLLRKVKTEIGLAFVIAHELGHHQHRHVLKQLGRGLLLMLLRGLSPDHEIATGKEILKFGFLSKSRNQEEEADLFALNLVYKAYGTTDGASEFFEMLKKDNEIYWEGPTFNSTHPSTGNRIEFIRNWNP